MNPHDYRQEFIELVRQEERDKVTKSVVTPPPAPPQGAVLSTMTNKLKVKKPTMRKEAVTRRYGGHDDLVLDCVRLNNKNDFGDRKLAKLVKDLEWKCKQT